MRSSAARLNAIADATAPALTLTRGEGTAAVEAGQPGSARVAAVDRAVDAAALVLIVGGIAAFVLARNALVAISEGTYHIPSGSTWVAQTDLQLAHAKLALGVIGSGVVVAVVGAVRHRRRAPSE